MSAKIMGLTFKVQKHLEGDPHQAARYFVALLTATGSAPTFGAELCILKSLKGKGYRFAKSPEGDFAVTSPKGFVTKGSEILAELGL
jgi:hypothetical protein